jgi:hypothetical protein
MKMTRTILRRLEMKIHHAMTLDEIRKQTGSEPQAKPEAGKTAGQTSLVPKLQG